MYYIHKYSKTCSCILIYLERVNPLIGNMLIVLKFLGLYSKHHALHDSIAPLDLKIITFNCIYVRKIYLILINHTVLLNRYKMYFNKNKLF